jgi:GNAT superfamily N-acetyltransferase
VIRVERTTSSDPRFVALIGALDRELRDTYGEIQNDYAPLNQVAVDTAVLALVDDDAVGSGCFKWIDAETVELKRMYVSPAHRGTGAGRAVIAELEAWARELGARVVILETGTRQARALALYERAGYVRTPPFGPYVGMEHSVCMRKALA